MKVLHDKVGRKGCRTAIPFLGTLSSGDLHVLGYLEGSSPDLLGGMRGYEGILTKAGLIISLTAGD